ncbi:MULTISPECIES: restriction endonuclease [unclassified Shewanella]|uniref:restriction endonuclease n=1 Tax=Shewanella TaxID=22 RepID=UPI001C5B40FD|nr:MULTISPECIES: restriction endonuclease [unclassified Shewanella]MBW3531117.1 restriction endonuclease [Shewanella sp. NKUCC06_TVS]MCU7964915.1 restriction endonuclease [Shewanella sp. SW32]MCU7972873.1 restriction endonuclease [Shewanella sp. SW29]MCU8000865.1 restriction endonuclease [Shewanella sp. SM95]MCU8021053.1 restriction endonuclease [Shewanella sp. SM78]
MTTYSLKRLDFDLLDYIFEMKGGYVLDFSNQTYSEFFNDELGINIDDNRFCDIGTSKGKRLRSYLKQSKTEEVLRVLASLWQYRETKRKRASIDEEKPELVSEFNELLVRLGGKAPVNKSKSSFVPHDEAINESTAKELLEALMQLAAMDPHPRGYAFESFLKNLFDVSGMSGRASFRLLGEQIDGSFELDGETYLLEAKWTNLPVNAADLRSFNAKVQDKAAWSRGLFVSNSGFTEEGLHAFGRGNSLVCMDGLDLSEMLMRKIGFKSVLSKKVRRAAETGKPFVRLRDLI